MIQILKTKRIFIDLQRRIFQLDYWILPPLTHLGLLPPRKNYYLLTLLKKWSKNPPVNICWKLTWCDYDFIYP